MPVRHRADFKEALTTLRRLKNQEDTAYYQNWQSSSSSWWKLARILVVFFFWASPRRRTQHRLIRENCWKVIGILIRGMILRINLVQCYSSKFGNSQQQFTVTDGVCKHYTSNTADDCVAHNMHWVCTYRALFTVSVDDTHRTSWLKFWAHFTFIQVINMAHSPWLALPFYFHLVLLLLPVFLFHLELFLELHCTIVMANLRCSAAEESKDTLNSFTSLTGCEPNLLTFGELNDSSVLFLFMIPSSDQDMDDVTLGKMLTAAHWGQVDHCKPEGISVSQSSSSARFDGSGQLDGERNVDQSVNFGVTRFSEDIQTVRMVDGSGQPDERNSSERTD